MVDLSLGDGIVREPRMTRLEKAIDSLRGLPIGQQDEVADVVLAIVEQRTSDVRLTPEQIEDVRRLEAELDAGRLEILTEREVEAMWRRLGA